MVWVGYESGARPVELLGLKLRDIQFDQHGAKMMVDGKTGERRIRLVESVDELKKWLEVHPRGNEPDASLCWSQKGGSLAKSAGPICPFPYRFRCVSFIAGPREFGPIVRPARD